MKEELLFTKEEWGAALPPVMEAMTSHLESIVRQSSNTSVTLRRMGYGILHPDRSAYLHSDKEHVTR